MSRISINSVTNLFMFELCRRLYNAPLMNSGTIVPIPPTGPSGEIGRHNGLKIRRNRKTCVPVRFRSRAPILMSSKLNSTQREAIKYLDGPLLVLAGAGSGKTRVITHKLAYLIEECGYSPRNIAAITFTNKAANEMSDRVGKLLGGRESKGLTISTFHALGMHILRQEAPLLGYKKQFSIFDSADTGKIISELLGTPDKQEIRTAQSVLSNWKASFLTPQEAESQAENEEQQRLALLYARYQETLRAYQSVDFDDLIRLPVELFKTHEEAHQRWQQRFRYLLIDEYQDTNDCQYQMMKLLAGSRAAVTVVGDDDQAIYAWRGASTANLHNLQSDYPTLRVIKLEQNYRSSQRILQSANHLIKNNTKLFDKNLWSEHGPGDPVRVFAAKDEENEAESVILRLLAHKFENNTRFADYAILYRSNHLSRVFEEQMRTHKVPYTVSGGTSFFDYAEIKDLTAYLRLIANPDDDPAFIRAVTTPKRGIGNSTLEKLAGLACSRQSACSRPHSRSRWQTSCSRASSKTCSPFATSSTACRNAPGKNRATK